MEYENAGFEMEGIHTASARRVNQGNERLFQTTSTTAAAGIHIPSPWYGITLQRITTLTLLDEHMALSR